MTRTREGGFTGSMALGIHTGIHSESVDIRCAISKEEKPRNKKQRHRSTKNHMDNKCMDQQAVETVSKMPDRTLSLLATTNLLKFSYGSGERVNLSTEVACCV